MLWLLAGPPKASRTARPSRSCRTLVSRRPRPLLCLQLHGLRCAPGSDQHFCLQLGQGLMRVDVNCSMFASRLHSYTPCHASCQATVVHSDCKQFTTEVLSFVQQLCHSIQPFRACSNPSMPLAILHSPGARQLRTSKKLFASLQRKPRSCPGTFVPRVSGFLRRPRQTCSSVVVWRGCRQGLCPFLAYLAGHKSSPKATRWV